MNIVFTHSRGCYNFIVQQDRQYHNKDNDRLIPPMNIDAKMLNKILTNQIQKYVKRVTHQGQLRFTPGMQGWLKPNRLISVILPINI